MAQEEAAIPSTPIPRVLSPEEAKKVLDAMPQGEAPKQKASDPKGEEEYSFSISVKDGAGNVLTGSFKNKILDLEERINIGLMQTAMVRNVPWETIDAETRWLVSALAHLSVSLIEKPEWFAKQTATLKLKNTRVIEKVYGEVARHEQYFRGAEPPQGVGA